VAVQQTTDATKQNLGYNRSENSYRPLPGVAYPIGLIVKFASLDQQVWVDENMVIPATTAATQQLQIGVVSDMWGGFGPAFGYTAPLTNARGTFNVDVITQGYHPALLIDQSGTGAATITNETPIIPSRGTSGYGMGTTTPVAGLGTTAVAMLPASGLCSSLTAAALVQASCTDTITGAPALNDVITVTVQIPYVTANPGVAQTRSVATTLTAAQAVSVTTAAAAVVAACNADAIYSLYYIASNVAGVITHTVVQGGTFTVNYSGTYNGTTVVVSQFSFTTSGSAMNGATHTSAAVGGSVSTASGNFANGTGYKGSIPAQVV